MKQFWMIMGAMSAIDAIVSVQARGKNKKAGEGKKEADWEQSKSHHLLFIT